MISKDTVRHTILEWYIEMIDECKPIVEPGDTIVVKPVSYTKEGSTYDIMGNIVGVRQYDVLTDSYEVVSVEGGNVALSNGVTIKEEQEDLIASEALRRMNDAKSAKGERVRYS